MKKTLFITMLIIFAGCAGKNFTWDQARQIKAGMTENELVTLMGPPYLVKSTNDGLLYVWSYADAFTGSKAVSVPLVNGRVVKAPPIPNTF